MKLSIIIPVYNSEKVLNKLIKSIIKNIKIKKNLIEIILINDFSIDQSWKEIVNLKKNYKFIKAINLNKNYGQHCAIFCGLKFSNGNFIICMDDDMQHNPKYIDKIVSTLKNGNEVCYVKYFKQKHNFFKVFISKLNNIISSYLMSKTIKIYTSSYKGFTKKIRDKIIKNKSDFVFLDYWMFKYTKKITFINVNHNKRYYGQTNYSFKKLLSLWSNMIFLIQVKEYNLKLFIILFLRFLFKFILNKYINYNQTNKILIKNKLL